MKTFISFLRAVNMTGHNAIRMADLAELYRIIGLAKPETYIQSGNVVFEADRDTPADLIAVSIEKAISEKYGYDVQVMVRTISEVKEILAANPYLSETNYDPAKMAVIFLRETATGEQLQKLTGVDYPPDKFFVKGTEIYTFCPEGFGKTKIYTNFFERRMKVRGTGRNINTIMAMLELAKKRG
jgi:uncharacterized protein (DUF1697 family)